MYYTFNVKDDEYKLKLTTDAICQVEDKLGGSLLLIFGVNGDRIPTTRELLTIFSYSLKANHPSIKTSEASRIFDAWLEEGHTITDFIPIVFEIYKASGIIKTGKDEKNA